MATWRGKMADSIETRLVVNVDSVDPVCIDSDQEPDTAPPYASESPSHSWSCRYTKTKKNAASSKKRSHVAGRSAHNPKSTSPYQRVREFPDENFIVSRGALFYSWCSSLMAADWRWRHWCLLSFWYFSIVSFTCSVTWELRIIHILLSISVAWESIILIFCENARIE